MLFRVARQSHLELPVSFSDCKHCFLKEDQVRTKMYNSNATCASDFMKTENLHFERLGVVDVGEWVNPGASQASLRSSINILPLTSDFFLVSSCKLISLNNHTFHHQEGHFGLISKLGIDGHKSLSQAFFFASQSYPKALVLCWKSGIHGSIPHYLYSRGLDVRWLPVLYM